MAQSLECVPLLTDIGGYDCDFVDSIPESLFCPICLLPFRDPHLLDCCGVKLCATCTDRIEAAASPCPQCRQRFAHILDQNTRRQVLNMKVRCSRKKDGCEWEGELRHLNKHERQDCGWTIEECRQCGRRIPRCLQAEHEREECPQRPVDVKLENFMHKIEMKLIFEKELHKREMAAAREELTNALQKEKENHKRELAVLEDNFKKALHEQQQSHKSELDQKEKAHAAQVQQMEQCITRKLAENKKEYAEKLKQLEQSLQRKLKADTEQQVLKLRKDVEEEVIPRCVMVKEIRAHLFGIPVFPPCEFTMTNYLHHKKEKDVWYSPSFYTGPGGYKMCLRVHAYGFRASAGTHVAMFVNLMRGEYDAQLEWPFQGDITIQLLNQIGDHDHDTSTVHFDDKVTASGCGSRVTSGERATLGWGYIKFLSHTAVESTTAAIQYLHNDCLRWRVSKIENV